VAGRAVRLRTFAPIFRHGGPPGAKVEASRQRMADGEHRCVMLPIAELGRAEFERHIVGEAAA